MSSPPRWRRSTRRCAGLANVRPALVLDVLRPDWPGVPAVVDAIFCANMLHISPWPTCAALMRGAPGISPRTACSLLYGPYVVDGEPTAPSNVAFDADLRARDAGWGLRRLVDVTAKAEAAGLALRERIAMPANNLLLVWARAGSLEAALARRRRRAAHADGLAAISSPPTARPASP